MGTSTFVANLLESNRLAYVGSGLRFANILMQKMPKIFSKYLKREGAIFQIDRLAAPSFLKKDNDVEGSSNTADIKTYISMEAEKFKKIYFNSEEVC